MNHASVIQQPAHLVLRVAALRALQLCLILPLRNPLSLLAFLFAASGGGGCLSRRPPTFDLLVMANPQNGAAVRCHPKTAVNTSGIPISWEDRPEVETAPDQMNLLECLLMALRVVWMVNRRPLQSPKLTSTANIVFMIASFVCSVTAIACQSGSRSVVLLSTAGIALEGRRSVRYCFD